jgi:hypothetical protein
MMKNLQHVPKVHQEDIGRALGCVYLPEALARKYPDAAREWDRTGLSAAPVFGNL